MADVVVTVSDDDLKTISYLAAPTDTVKYLGDVLARVVAEQVKTGQTESDRQAFEAWKAAKK